MQATDRFAADASSDRRPDALVARLAAAALAVLAIGQLWLVFHRSLNADEFEHAHATWCVSRGLLPYRDFFQHHTPWLYYIFAPLFARTAAAADGDAAVRLLMLCRLAMLIVTAACVALTAMLGRLWRDARTGWLAAFFLASSIQFLDTMIEFRPDVPALACWLTTMVCLVRGWRSDRSSAAAAWFAGGGAALAAALLFTQKYVFALPGVAIALAVYVVWRRPAEPGVRGRVAAAVVFVLALCAPVAATLAWFAAQGAGSVFLYYNFAFNVGQNADRFSPLPILLSNLVHSPILMVLGTIGFVDAVRAVRQRGADDRVPLVAGAASLLAGLLVFGRVYGQYMVMFFPHLAVFAAETAPRASRWLQATLRSDYRLRLGVSFLLPPAVLALLFGIEHPETRKGLAMLNAFVLMAWFGVVALRMLARGQSRWALVLGIAAFTAMTAGNAARIYWPMAPQVAELRYVTEATRPDDPFLGSGLPAGAGTFRPHAWYFYFQPIFASDRELAEIVEQVVSGRLRPKIIGFDIHDGGIPPPLRGYVAAHYRLVRGSLYERLPD